MSEKKLILEYIDSLELGPGDRLPTETQLCRKFHLTRYRVRQLINELTGERNWVKIQGSGCYLPGGRREYKPIERTIALMASLATGHVNEWVGRLNVLANQANFNFLFLQLQNLQLEVERECLDHFTRRRIHSLIIDPYPESQETIDRLDGLQSMGMRCVLLNGDEELRRKYPFSGFNYRKAGYMAVVYLMRQGVGRIIHVGQYRSIAWQHKDFKDGVEEAARDFKIPVRNIQSRLCLNSRSDRPNWEPSDFELPLEEGTGYINDDSYFAALAMYFMLQSAGVRHAPLITVGWDRFNLPFANLFFDNARRMTELVSYLVETPASEVNKLHRIMDPVLIDPDDPTGGDLSLRL